MAGTRVRPPGARPVKLTPSRVKPPTLRGDIDWHPAARRLWRMWWASPMANQWGQDIEGLYGLILLVNDREKAENGRERATISTEIRLQRDAYGLSPASRRKLGWGLPDEPEVSAGAAKTSREPPKTSPADVDIFAESGTSPKSTDIPTDGETEYAAAGEIGVLPE
jgi:hypothetical protein